ncbi:hypothetical protein OG21DRAFT_435831 [Imleria badia]|nr:hypothetical protein OG21DRAFT_435831 [Imleria badia]
MDSDSDARPTSQVSSEPTLTAYHQGATDVGPVSAAPRSAFASSPVTWTPSPHLDSHSRDNLRQASVALDTAYERITSLRNSINNMLNRIPPEVAGTGSSPTTSTDTSDTQPRHSPSHDANLRPPHSALVLSGEQVAEELNQRAARLRSLISPSARQRLEEFESNNRNNDNDSDSELESILARLAQNDNSRRRDRSDRHPMVPPPLRTPPMPDLVLPRARDPVDPRAAQRRDLQSANRDDASTMIGRRVAARENASESLSSRLSLSQIEQRLQAQTAQVARELENMTERLAASSRSRRVELASPRARGDNAATAAQDNRTSQAGPIAVGVETRVVPNPPAGGRPLRPTRDVTLVDHTSRIVLPQQISRTSSDGAPIDELPVPARRSLSAAFREHIATYRDYVQVANTSQDSPRNLANTPEVRGTLVNLLTRDRDDQFLSVPARPEYARPGAESNRRDDASVRSNPSSPPGQGRRRRGWSELFFDESHPVLRLIHATARLNADGDEIDSDEDDNVSPHTRRLRMRFSYGTPSAEQPQPATRSHTVTIEDILWRTSSSDSEADVLSPDATESCQSLFQGSPPCPASRRPHPLPTPVEDMLIYPATKPPQRPQVICVSKYASLAGR